MKTKPKTKPRHKRTELQRMITTADKKFREWIKDRDGWECQLCGLNHDKYLVQCSHFIGCEEFNTRYDPLNSITLCIYCHAELEGQKKSAYRDFMVRRLGEETVSELERKGWENKDQRLAVEEFNRWYKEGK